MPKVDLLYFTGKETGDPLYPARLMVFTKQTRLNMTPGAFDTAMKIPEATVMQELDYMSKTIPSSWEFIDFMFLISDVSRATAQQITRMRTASFAMQSQRVTDMSDVSWDSDDELKDAAIQQTVDLYAELVNHGMSLEDARDVLPIGVHCNLVMKANFRNLVEMLRARESARVQGPYREVVRQMKQLILTELPWTSLFFRDPKQLGYDMLNEVIDELKQDGAVYQGAAGKVAKAIDLIKKAK